jgi:hypothetical protein
MGLVLFRRRRPLESIDEAGAYARCHGERLADIRIVKLPPRRKRYPALMRGEDIRVGFEDRLAAREPELS